MFIIFDFDGVIIDSYVLMRQAFITACCKVMGCTEEEGLSHFKIFRCHMGKGLQEILRHMHLPKLIASEFITESRRNLSKIIIFPGIKDLIEKLSQCGYQLALATGKERDRTLEILDYHSMRKYFREVICSDDVERSKPNPEMLLRVLKNLGCRKPNEAVMIGDAEADYLAAKNADIPFLLAQWDTHRNTDWVDKYRFDINTRLPQPRSIFDYLGSL